MKYLNFEIFIFEKYLIVIFVFCNIYIKKLINNKINYKKRYNKNISQRCEIYNIKTINILHRCKIYSFFN